ncbi:MAG: DUF4302 domain-containing protein [Paludibacter sp.]
MKKTIYILFTFIIILFSNCTKEEADIFNDSAANRVTNAMKSANDTLQSATNGWVMEYFATPQSAGYNLFVKFNKSGQAIISGKNYLTNNLLVTDSCLYEIIGDNGPVLTFNTFNKVLHAFSNPINPDGYGLEGDYEFVVIKCSKNQILLKGKKRGTDIILNRLPETVGIQQYVANLEVMDSVLFGKNTAKQSLIIEGQKFWFSNGNSHIYSILKDGDDVNTSIDAPFIITQTGIRFHSVQTIENKSFQTLQLNPENSALVSAEDANIILTGQENLADYFQKSTNYWVFNPTKLSPKVKAIYDLIVTTCKTKFYSASPSLAVKDVQLMLKYNSKEKAYSLILSIKRKSTAINGEVYLSTLLSGSNLKFTFTGSGDASGLSFYDSIGKKPDNTIAGFKEMVGLLSSELILNTDASFNPQNIKFTQKLDTDSWFTVSCQ